MDCKIKVNILSTWCMSTAAQYRQGSKNYCTFQGYIMVIWFMIVFQLWEVYGKRRCLRTFIGKFIATSFPMFSPTCPYGARENLERGWVCTMSTMSLNITAQKMLYLQWRRHPLTSSHIKLESHEISFYPNRAAFVLLRVLWHQRELCDRELKRED